MEYEELADLASEMMSPTDGVPVKTRKYLLKSYPSSFLGSEAVSWLAKRKDCSKPAALALGNQLFKAGLIHHSVDKSKPLLDGFFFYRFSSKVQKRKGSLGAPQIPTSVKGIARMMSDRKLGIDVKVRKYRLKSYKDCFVAAEAVDWMLKNLAFRTRNEGVEMGQKLVEEGYIEHVCDTQPFKDAYLFFRFTQSTQAPPTPKRDGDEDDEADAPVCAADFEKMTLLGEGGYGKVWLVKKQTTGKVYAMKVLEKSKIKSQKALEHTITEKQVLINNSPFLLHLHFSFQTPTKLYMITDYLAGGDMFFHLSKKNGSGFSSRVGRFFAAELVLALEHLHQCGVIYRDLKLENVLLDEQGHICLADFGLSKVLDSSDSTQTFCGSQGYLAPEILRGETYTYNVDWFSLGVIVYEMMSGTNPFLGADFHETCRNILHKHVTFPSTFFSSKASDLLGKLLARDSSERIQSADEIKAHPWFKGLDWSKLELKKVVPPFKISVMSKDSTENFDEFFTKMEITQEQNDSSSDSDRPGKPNIFGDFNYVSPDL